MTCPGYPVQMLRRQWCLSVARKIFTRFVALKYLLRLWWLELHSLWPNLYTPAFTFYLPQSQQFRYCLFLIPLFSMWVLQHHYFWNAFCEFQQVDISRRIFGCKGFQPTCVVQLEQADEGSVQATWKAKNIRLMCSRGWARYLHTLGPYCHRRNGTISIDLLPEIGSYNCCQKRAHLSKGDHMDQTKTNI